METGFGVFVAAGVNLLGHTLGGQVSKFGFKFRNLTLNSSCGHMACCQPVVPTSTQPFLTLLPNCTIMPLQSTLSVSSAYNATNIDMMNTPVSVYPGLQVRPSMAISSKSFKRPDNKSDNPKVSNPYYDVGNVLMIFYSLLNCSAATLELLPDALSHLLGLFATRCMHRKNLKRCV